MRPFFETHEDHIVIIPTLSLMAGRCDCCGDVGAYMVFITFLVWDFGLVIEFGPPPTHGHGP